MPHRYKTPGFWIEDSERGWANRRNIEFGYVTSEGWVFGSLDEEGYRPVLTCRDQSESPIVVCVGDSTTFSGEARDDQTWPEAAARALSDKGRSVRMLNRGVGGYSAMQSMITLRQALRDPTRAPWVRAAVYHFFFNDPEENFGNGGPNLILEEFGVAHTASKADACHITPPRPWPSTARSSQDLSLEYSAFAAAIRAVRRDTSEAVYREGAGGLKGITDLCEEFLAKTELQEGMRYVLREMREECRSRNVPLFVSVYPCAVLDDEGPSRRDFVELTGESADRIRAQAASYNAACDLVKRMAEEAGATFIDLRGCLSGLTHREYLARPHDWHLSGAANERIGSAIANRLSDLRLGTVLEK